MPKVISIQEQKPKLSSELQSAIDLSPISFLASASHGVTVLLHACRKAHLWEVIRPKGPCRHDALDVGLSAGFLPGQPPGRTGGIPWPTAARSGTRGPRSYR
ncbi:hypothetical protein B296_00046364 [Ensete ventricosum]|uniref:Uncharacterized protein n=1 Tax=Ensete ventricosum TaxID=4639 RepID=A0A426YR99_ENSVE|nr:hypothetical protein B296_00046364 [Ensete ventricosum]